MLWAAPLPTLPPFIQNLPLPFAFSQGLLLSLLPDELVHQLTDGTRVPPSAGILPAGNFCAEGAAVTGPQEWRLERPRNKRKKQEMG